MYLKTAQSDPHIRCSLHLKRQLISGTELALIACAATYRGRHSSPYLQWCKSTRPPKTCCSITPEPCPALSFPRHCHIRLLPSRHQFIPACFSLLTQSHPPSPPLRASLSAQLHPPASSVDSQTSASRTSPIFCLRPPPSSWRSDIVAPPRHGHARPCDPDNVLLRPACPTSHFS